MHTIFCFMHTKIMVNLVKNILLYISAFVPMYFLILVKILSDLIFNDGEFTRFVKFEILFFVILVGLGIIGLVWNVKWSNIKTSKVYIKDCRNVTDHHFLGYISIFILFSLGFDLSKASMLAIFIFTFIFIGIVYVNNKLFYINPFLNILGFNFFEITYTKDGSTEEHTAKVFFKGKLEACEKSRTVKIKNDHFAFVDKGLK